MGPQVSLGDPLVLVGFVGLAPARKEDPAVEPAFFGLGSGPQSPKGLGDVGSGRGGGGDHGGFVGDGELEAQQGGHEGGGGGPNGFGVGLAFGVGPGELDNVVDVAVEGGADVEVCGQGGGVDFAQGGEDGPSDGGGGSASRDK